MWRISTFYGRRSCTRDSCKTFTESASTFMLAFRMPIQMPRASKRCQARQGGNEPTCVIGYQLAGTTNASSKRRIEIKALNPNELSAFITPPKVSGAEPLYGSVESASARLPPRFGPGRHGLVLKCVHARQAACRLLVEFHRATLLARALGSFAQCGQFLPQTPKIADP